MSGIGRIGGSGYNNYNLYNTERNQEKHTRNVSSGKKLNQASDGAAEMAIAKKLANAAKGYSVGSSNLQAGYSAINIADGAMSGISDSLQRMRELSIRANNGLMGDDERRAIQDEISQVTQGIDEGARNAQFNEKPLLSEDGNVTLLANNEGSSGTSLDITTEALNSQALGVDNYSVLQNFDLGDIDRAMEKLSSARSVEGAQANSIEYARSYNAVAAENITSSQSVLEDADIAEEMMAVNTNKALTAVDIMMRKREEEEAQNNSARILGQ